MNIRVGSVVGDYEVLELLGSGGVGVVFKTRHKIMGRTEAIKVLLPGSVYDPAHIQRFLREVEVQANLAHPNIASVRHAFQFEGSLVMVMELVEGDALDKRLARGRLPLASALNYATQALAALGYAHSLGVVHRDVKPSNMLITPQGRLKMSDFGLAKRAGDPRLTATQSALGSLFYMSPEQVNGLETLDARTDIYSMGAVLYELTTGKPPFEQEQPFQLMRAHVETVPRPPHEVEPAIPKQLSDIILKALEKAPENRYQSAMGFLQAIAPVRDPLVRPANLTQPTYSLDVKSRAVNKERRRVVRGGGASAEQREIDDGARQDHYRVAARLLAGVRSKLVGMRFTVATAAAMLLTLGLWAAYSPVTKPTGETAPEASSIDLDLSVLDLATSTAVPSGRHELVRRIVSGSVIKALAISADGSRVAGISQARTIDVWDAYRGERVGSQPSEITAQRLTISSDGKLVAFTYNDGRVRLWEADTNQRPVELVANGHVQAIVFSDDNRHLAVAYPNSLDIWDVSDRTRPRQAAQYQLSAQAVAFSPEGTTLAVASTADSVDLVSLDPSARSRTIGVYGGVTTLSFSPDGIWLAAAGKHGIKVWEQDITDTLLSLVPELYLAVAITPLGRCVALTLSKETAQIWDATVNQQLSAFRHSHELTAAALSRNGQVAVTASLAGDLWIWKAPFGWDRPQPSETLLTRAIDRSRMATGKRRAKPTPSQSDQRSKDLGAPSAPPPLTVDSAGSQESPPAQPNLPVITATAEKAAVALPREKPSEGTHVTFEPVQSADASAVADHQDEPADEGEDQKNPEKKKKNIFRRVIGVFK